MNKEIKEKSNRGGAVLWARKVFESDIFVWKPAVWFKIWFYIVGNVSWKDSKHFKRGTGFFTYKKIQSTTKAKRAQIDHCIRWLKGARSPGEPEAQKDAIMIATQKAMRGMVITVLKYDKYQNFDNYKSDTESDDKSDTKATQKRHKSDTIIEEGKERDIIPPSEVEAPPPSAVKIVYGRPDINMVYEYLTQKVGGSLDGSREQNRKFAKLLLDRLEKDFPEREPAEQLKYLIDFGLKDEFHRKNVTSFKYLYYNMQKIIQSFKSKDNRILKIS